MPTKKRPRRPESEAVKRNEVMELSNHNRIEFGAARAQDAPTQSCQHVLGQEQPRSGGPGKQ